MSDTTKVDDKTRASISEQIDALTKADASLDLVMKPFREAQSAILNARELLLEHHGVEIAASCEGCDKLIFVGEKGHQCEDGPTLCAACSPTYGDSRDQRVKALAAATDDEERKEHQEAIDGIDAYVAAGGSLDDPAVYEL